MYAHQIELIGDSLRAPGSVASLHVYNEINTIFIDWRPAFTGDR